MRVLVSGASGFIGRHVTAHLEGIGWDVVAWSHAHTVAHPDDERRAPLERPFDYFVDLAARTSVAWSVEHPADCLHQNLRATVRFLEWARAYPPRVFLHLSTAEQGDVRNPYGASKVAQEAACWAYRAAFDVPIVVLSADIVVGLGQPETKAVPTMAAAIRAGEPVPIWMYGTQPGKRLYASVTSLADAIRFLLERGSGGHRDDRPRYLMSGRELTNYHLALLLGEILDVHDWAPDMVPGPTYVRPGSSWDGVALSSLGWAPPVMVETEIRRQLGVEAPT